MPYPNMPPITEAKVQTNAIFSHLVRAAKTIGINKISGGIGKNELSIKEIAAKAHIALGWADKFITQS